MKTISHRLRHLVEEAKRDGRIRSQADAAAALGLSPQTFSTYVNGREPNFQTACAVADYFDVSLDYLLGRTDVKKISDTPIYEELGLNSEAIANLKEMKHELSEAKNSGHFKEYLNAFERLSAINFLLENMGTPGCDILDTLAAYLWFLPHKETLTFEPDRENLGYKLVASESRNPVPSAMFADNTLSMDDLYEEVLYKRFEKQVHDLRIRFQNEPMLSNAEFYIDSVFIETSSQNEYMKNMKRKLSQLPQMMKTPHAAERNS